MTTRHSDQYTKVAIALHWVIALLIIGQIAGGVWMTRTPDDAAELKFEIFQLHKSFGVLILALSFVRLLWRATHRVPALPEALTAWEKAAARGVHAGFYVLMIGTPLIGWAYVSAAPLRVPTYIFGVLPWPHLPFFGEAENRESLASALAGAHEVAAFAILALLALHVGAAAMHHFVKRDEVLARMVPFLRRNTG